MAEFQMYGNNTVSNPYGTPPQGGTMSSGNSLMDMFTKFSGNGGEGGFASSSLGMVAQAILGGLSASSSAKAASKAAEKASRQRMSDSAYSKALGDWYDRRDKSEWRKGAADFGQFSTLSNFAPNYKPTYEAAPLGAQPTQSDYIVGGGKKANAKKSAAQNTYAQSTVGSNG